MSKMGEFKKLARALRMLKIISVMPGLDAVTLGKLLSLSTRGAYRYIAELKELGISIKNENGGYVLEDSDILRAISWKAQEGQSD